jgi:hypothetical protein
MNYDAVRVRSFVFCAVELSLSLRNDRVSGIEISDIAGVNPL